MPNTLEATLAHYTQLMRYNFIYLDPGITQTTKAQMPHLEKLGVSVNRLRITLEKLPPSYDSLDKAM